MRLSLGEFKRSLMDEEPPAGLTSALRALWWTGKGNWEAAHKIVMDEPDRNSAWLHAYLHRVEGDLANAGYWYRQAGRAAAAGPIESEWETIAVELISERGHLPPV